MKRIFPSGLCFATVAIFLFKCIIDPLPIGAPVPNPDKKMKDVSGKEFSFKDVINKNGLLVMFSCNFV